MEHSNAGADGFGRRLELDRLPVEQYLARVAMNKAGQDFHQGRFARAVFAQQSMNRPRFYGNANTIVRMERAKVLVNILEFKAHGYPFCRGGGATESSGPASTTILLYLLGPVMPCSNCGRYHISLSAAVAPSFT